MSPRTKDHPDSRAHLPAVLIAVLLILPACVSTAEIAATDSPGSPGKVFLGSKACAPGVTCPASVACKSVEACVEEAQNDEQKQRLESQKTRNEELAARLAAHLEYRSRPTRIATRIVACVVTFYASVLYFTFRRKK